MSYIHAWISTTTLSNQVGIEAAESPQYAESMIRVARQSTSPRVTPSLPCMGDGHFLGECHCQDGVPCLAVASRNCPAQCQLFYQVST